MADSPPTTSEPPQPAGSPWLETAALCQRLAISRSTLCRWRQRRVLRQGIHWVRKNPAAPRSDHLWHLDHCRDVIAARRCFPASTLRRPRPA
ncbi:hypothetical protein [Vulcanococcus limneticus]|uniref:hypothetical protein n=1 Tax=Vulcanococcus limneticus TaxID=2170428 RepID=UPI00398BCAD1